MGSVGETVFEDAPDGADAVFPGDFFALLVAAAVVADGDFVDDGAAAGEFGGDFDFEAEAFFLEVEGLDALAFEEFVADLHVGEVDVGHHVGEGGEEAVADVVPVVDDAVGAAAEEAGAVDDIGAAFEDGLEESGVVVGVVFEVGILDEDDIAGGFGEAGVEGGAFALVVVVEGGDDVGEAGGEGGEEVAGAVGGAVIDEDDFALEAGVDAADGFEEVGEGLDLVVDGDDDGELHVECV